jgi:hypothetical protein
MTCHGPYVVFMTGAVRWVGRLASCFFNEDERSFVFRFAYLVHDQKESAHWEPADFRPWSSIEFLEEGFQIDLDDREAFGCVGRVQGQNELVVLRLLLKPPDDFDENAVVGTLLN